MSDAYVTIGETVDVELEITRSRFLAHLERVESEAEAREVIARMRHEHPKARHHCSAFVVGPDARLRRSNDDGEPSGTAGAPILDALASADGCRLSDVVCVVTRYFGGTLLGAGGLTRAYRAATAEAVSRAPRVRRELRVEVAVTCAYDVAPQLEAECRRRGFGIGAADYAADVTRRVLVAEDDIAAVAEIAAELSGGAARVDRLGAGYADLHVGGSR